MNKKMIDTVFKAMKKINEEQGLTYLDASADEESATTYTSLVVDAMNELDSDRYDGNEILEFLFEAEIQELGWDTNHFNY